VNSGFCLAEGYSPSCFASINSMAGVSPPLNKGLIYWRAETSKELSSMAAITPTLHGFNQKTIYHKDSCVAERAACAGTALLRFWESVGFSFKGKPFDVQWGKMDATRKMDTLAVQFDRVARVPPVNHAQYARATLGFLRLGRRRQRIGQVVVNGSLARLEG
jgi:hypothetical protein